MRWSPISTCVVYTSILLPCSLLEYINNWLANFDCMWCMFTSCTVFMLKFIFSHLDYVVAPEINDTVKLEDVYVNSNKPIYLVLPCPVKRSYPPPDVIWLRNGVPLDGVLFNATFDPSTFSLILTSRNTSYDFVYEHIIGMYQCFVSNEAGSAVTSSRVVFNCEFVSAYLVYVCVCLYSQ